MSQTGELRIDYLGKLETLMGDALRRVNDKTYKRVSDALLPLLPAILETLQGIIVDSTSSATTKMRCVEILMATWSRCLRFDLSDQKATAAIEKAQAQREQAAAARATANAQNKADKLEIAREQKRIARKLAKAARIIEKENCEQTGN